ncbi:hypothetical protein ABH942_001280, partial [Flavobacterium sp. 28YEA47A]|uniref:hypothetical protein n=1 Tax=Flavobacterium sp. 28YEA47A TaxID=3156276 RepID=UPI0035126AE4
EANRPKFCLIKKQNSGNPSGSEQTEVLFDKKNKTPETRAEANRPKFCLIKKQNSGNPSGSEQTEVLFDKKTKLR